jgi:hypothetical protein
MEQKYTFEVHYKNNTLRPTGWHVKLFQEALNDWGRYSHQPCASRFLAVDLDARPEDEFLDVESQEFSSLLFTVTSTNG